MRFDDNLGLNVVRCLAGLLGTKKSLSLAFRWADILGMKKGLSLAFRWADILGMKKGLSLAYSMMMWGLMSSDVRLTY